MYFCRYWRFMSDSLVYLHSHWESFGNNWTVKDSKIAPMSYFFRKAFFSNYRIHQTAMESAEVTDQRNVRECSAFGALCYITYVHSCRISIRRPSGQHFCPFIGLFLFKNYKKSSINPQTFRPAESCYCWKIVGFSTRKPAFHFSRRLLPNYSGGPFCTPFFA